jgi:hypothetical protein
MPAAPLWRRLVGPLYYRALVTGEEITEAFLTQLVTATLAIVRA